MYLEIPVIKELWEIALIERENNQIVIDEKIKNLDKQDLKSLNSQKKMTAPIDTIDSIISGLKTISECTEIDKELVIKYYGERDKITANPTISDSMKTIVDVNFGVDDMKLQSVFYDTCYLLHEVRRNQDFKGADEKIENALKNFEALKKIWENKPNKEVSIAIANTLLARLKEAKKALL